MVARLSHSSKALQHMSPMILASKEDGQYPYDLGSIIYLEVKHGAVLRDAAQSSREFRQKRSLMRGEGDRVYFGFDHACARRSSMNRIGQRLAQADIRIDQMPDDSPKISVAFERPYDLKGHRTSSSRQLCLRDAGGFPLGSRMGLSLARRSMLSLLQFRQLSILSLPARALGRVATLRSYLKSVRPPQVSGQSYLAALKSKRMFSRPSGNPPCLNRSYHSVAPSSISGAAP
jgi:hypothetical protein